MMTVVSKFKQLRTDRRGISALEYALIAGLIGIVLVAGATSLGSAINSKLSSVATSVTNAGSASSK